MSVTYVHIGLYDYDKYKLHKLDISFENQFPLENLRYLDSIFFFYKLNL